MMAFSYSNVNGASTVFIWLKKNTTCLSDVIGLAIELPFLLHRTAHVLFLYAREFVSDKMLPKAVFDERQ